MSLDPLFNTVRRLRRFQHGCVVQYQGNSAFQGWKPVQSCFEYKCEVCRNCANCEKCRADGDTHAFRLSVKQSFNDQYGEGSRDLVRHMVANFPLPVRSRKSVGSIGLYSPTTYIYMYVPEDGIDYNLVAADSGYEGSRKDHYCRSEGATMENDCLKRRRIFCGCEPCMKLLPGCSLTPANSARTTGTIPEGTFVWIKLKRPDAEVDHTGRTSKPLKEFS